MSTREKGSCQVIEKKLEFLVPGGELNYRPLRHGDSDWWPGMESNRRGYFFRVVVDQKKWLLIQRLPLLLRLSFKNEKGYSTIKFPIDLFDSIQETKK